MAGTIDTTDLVVVEDADGTAFGGTSYSGFQREGTGCEGGQISAGTIQFTRTITSADLSASSLHGWMLLWNNPDTFTVAGFGIVVGDGTNTIAYAVGGTGTPDVQGVFFKNGWQSFQLNCASPPTDFIVIAGSEASLDMSAITTIGYYMDATETALGKVDNCFVDVLWKYLNVNYPARIEGGTSGSPATFSDLADYDFSSAADRALGVMYEVDTGVFEVQAPITIGDNGTAASYFSSSNEEVIFIDKPVNNFKFDLIGNATGQNEAYFTGVTFRNANSSINPTFDWNDANFEYMQIDACAFLSIGTIDLPTTSVNRFVINSTFDGCGLIDPSTVKFEDNTVRNATGTAMTLANPTTQGVKNCSFISVGTGYAIEITATGTYTFTGMTYSGYGATGTTDAVVYNNSGGAVTINVVGGDTPTYKNGSGASTTVVASVNLKLTVKDSNGNAIVGARCLMEAGDGTGSAPFEDSVTITSSGTTATVAHTAHGLSTGQMVNIRDANQHEYNGAGKVVTVTGVDAYTYTISGSPASPATGTITSTQCFMSEITITGGIAEESFNSAGTQTYRGRVAMSSSSPYYKDVTFSGSDCSGGLDLPIQMASDE